METERENMAKKQKLLMSFEKRRFGKRETAELEEE